MEWPDADVVQGLLLIPLPVSGPSASLEADPGWAFCISPKDGSRDPQMDCQMAAAPVLWERRRLWLVWVPS